MDWKAFILYACIWFLFFLWIRAERKIRKAKIDHIDTLLRMRQNHRKLDDALRRLGIKADVAEKKIKNLKKRLDKE